MRALAMLVLVAAADPAATYGFDRSQIEGDAFDAVTSGGYAGPWVGPQSALRQLDGAGRAKAIRAIGAVAKAYLGSADFTRRYADWRKQQLGDAPEPPRSYDQAVADTKAQLDKSIAELESRKAQLPADQRASLEQIIARMKQSQSAMLPPKEAYEQSVAAQAAQAKADYAERQQRYPEDPQAAVKAALQRFLDATAGIDFHAKLEDQNGRKRFVDPALEAKPDLWKRAFRAGPEATGAARSFAQAWLDGVK